MINTYRKPVLLSILAAMALVYYSCEKIDPAKIETGQIQEITVSAAKAVGNIIDLGGGVIEYGHCWSTSAEPGLNDMKTSFGSPTIGSFTSEITGLDAGLTYYVRAYAVQEDKVVYGTIQSFNTSEGIPQLTTSAISGLKIGSAISGGDVTGDSGAEISVRGVCWNTSGNPTIDDNHTSDGLGLGNFVSDLTELQKNVTIYVRAYATSSYGTGYGNEVEFIITVVAGSDLTDSRDGKVYKTAQIGNQLWMAENLNVGVMVSDAVGQTDNGIIEKFSYNNDDSYSDIYGGLYFWDEMMQYTTSVSTQGVCPDGWHLPSDEEWMKLESFLGMADTTLIKTSWRGNDAEGYKLKDTGNEYDWSPGSNESGFTALPGGRYKGKFEELDTIARFWTSSGSGTNAWYRGLAGDLIGRNNIAKNTGRSVRCVKDQ